MHLHLPPTYCDAKEGTRVATTWFCGVEWDLGSDVETTLFLRTLLRVCDAISPYGLTSSHGKLFPPCLLRRRSLVGWLIANVLNHDSFCNRNKETDALDCFSFFFLHLSQHSCLYFLMIDNYFDRDIYFTFVPTSFGRSTRPSPFLKLLHTTTFPWKTTLISTSLWDSMLTWAFLKRGSMFSSKWKGKELFPWDGGKTHIFLHFRWKSWICPFHPHNLYVSHLTKK